MSLVTMLNDYQDKINEKSKGFRRNKNLRRLTIAIIDYYHLDSSKYSPCNAADRPTLSPSKIVTYNLAGAIL
jgi:hypothetical protein